MNIILQLNIKGLVKIIWLFLFLFFISCGSQITYEGERNQEGKYHGKGILTSYDEKYEGEFNDGLKHGQGRTFL